MNHPILSIVIPVYNEEQNIGLIYQRLIAATSTITDNIEIIWVDDGSTDNSLELVKSLKKTDGRNKFISFSRNFGHQVALIAGINACKGDAAVTIDGDLQDPPELIAEMYAKYKEGYKVVYAQRRSRAGENPFRNFAIKLFYRLLKKTTRVNIPLDTGDFRLMDRKIVDVLKQMPERNKFIRGQIAWAGFKQTPVYYDRDRRHGGKSNYPLMKLVRLAIDGFTSFSNFPLKLATILGFVVSGIAFILILYALYSKFQDGSIITGWTSLMISTMFIGGVQLICLGIIGEYISRMNTDVRKRPLYVIEEEELIN